MRRDPCARRFAISVPPWPKPRSTALLAIGRVCLRRGRCLFKPVVIRLPVRYSYPSDRKEKSMARKFAFITLLVVLLAPLAAFADDDDDNNKLKAVPFAFVGTAAQYGDPAGARIVTSAWLGGMGLPDNGGRNFNARTPGDP